MTQWTPASVNWEGRASAERRGDRGREGRRRPLRDERSESGRRSGVRRRGVCTNRGQRKATSWAGSCSPVEPSSFASFKLSTMDLIELNEPFILKFPLCPPLARAFHPLSCQRQVGSPHEEFALSGHGRWWSCSLNRRGWSCRECPAGRSRLSMHKQLVSTDRHGESVVLVRTCRHVTCHRVEVDPNPFHQTPYPTLFRHV